MIINHIYRLNHVGKVCSGAFLSDEERALAEGGDEYLLRRGKFLLILLIIYWVIFGLACLCCCGLLTIALAAGKQG
eukprot:CAMPEP_0202964470 /NCGR_PEP_ID=MMETSP1396-20130829/8553_1 /ASSEMBLY_ACC=CAM_ASM_000872 /TAXON_ID= /ORGANISM="Pseudokeronopsis sp., Strain Brazil" /LENGTH=75 /DNA_ID=CAMNT_0049686599 /DNA_START=394 /DNA_END=621 /DNA_ORIENTATION=+